MSVEETSWYAHRNEAVNRASGGWGTTSIHRSIHRWSNGGGVSGGIDAGWAVTVTLSRPVTPENRSVARSLPSKPTKWCGVPSPANGSVAVLYSPEGGSTTVFNRKFRLAVTKYFSAPTCSSKSSIVPQRSGSAATSSRISAARLSMRGQRCPSLKTVEMTPERYAVKPPQSSGVASYPSFSAFDGPARGPKVYANPSLRSEAG